MNKRGQFEIQFNWIFVLAIGALILLFFSIIMLKQKNISEITINQFTSRTLEAILAGAEVSASGEGSSTLKFIDVPKLEIDFECNKYRIGSAQKNFEIMSIFASSKVKSNKIMTWTLSWSLPFRVTNFIYLTSPNIRYILIGDDNLAFSINKTMPKELNKELIKPSNLNNVKNKQDAKVRFIFLNTNVDDSIISKFSKMKDEDVTSLKVDGSKDTGTIDFLRKDKNTNTFVSQGNSFYLKEQSLIGAIFTDDIKMYECSMRNAFKKLNMVTRIYQSKTKNLHDFYYGLDDSCYNYHKSDNIDIILGASKDFKYENIENINSHSIALEYQNKQAQLQSCALIY